ncbi:MAG TPA: hypothetical protein VE988_26165 [Gemmataceae bacterium]|nr:hypothetical protein [Gemmataceae bacterium]
MAPTSTKPVKKTSQPDFWEKYSPRHECPISFSTALLVWVFIIAVATALGVVMGEGDYNKPPLMDVVEIEGGGGGLGTGIGPGSPDKGDPNQKEGVTLNKKNPQSKDDIKISKFEFKDLAKNDIKFPIDDEPNVQDNAKDPFAALAEFKGPPQDVPLPKAGDPAGKGGGDKKGSGGGKGGGDGKGSGTAKGPGGGSSPKGTVLNDQRRRELRWVIFASPDGDIHVKKLQALKVTLVIPLRPKPGEPVYALSYDLSKSLKPNKIQAADDPTKVRWVNKDAHEMMGLAKALRLSEVPPFAVIYLPADLESDMARRELAHQGRQEHEILLTKWDVRERDGSYENEPYIVQQILRPGVK